MKEPLYIPTKIFFGCGAYPEKVLTFIEEKHKRILIVASRTVVAQGQLFPLTDTIKHERPDLEVIVETNISPNPKSGEINVIVETIGSRAKAVDLVIALGGGSVMDAAKAVAAALKTGVRVEDLNKNEFSALPVVAIPTTAGTGSEVSKGAIVTFESAKIKTGLRGYCLFPVGAVVDPTLTVSVPMQTTMETGFDILAHAIETYISRKSNPFTEMLSQKAIETVRENLPKLREDLNDVEARTNMSYASMLMGMNLANSGTALPHRLQYPVGALTDTGHGAGLCALYTPWLNYQFDFSPEKMLNVSLWLFGDRLMKTAFIDRFSEFLQNFNLKTTLTQLGIAYADIDFLISRITGSINDDPVSETEDISRKVYVDALSQ
jgi:alcohol dehydrogenase class IV